MQNVPWQIEKIISTANELASSETTGASTSETIAAAFVLDRREFIPQGYSIIEAWERLGEEWQGYVKQVIAEYSNLLVPW